MINPQVFFLSICIGKARMRGWKKVMLPTSAQPIGGGDDDGVFATTFQP